MKNVISLDTEANGTASAPETKTESAATTRQKNHLERAMATAVNVGLDPLLKRSQVATIANVSVSTVKRWEGAGMLIAVRINSRVTRYRTSNVKNLLENL